MLLESEFNLVGPKWVVAIMFHKHLTQMLLVVTKYQVKEYKQ